MPVPVRVLKDYGSRYVHLVCDAHAEEQLSLLDTAYANEGGVLSEEKSRVGGRGDAKIPDVCEQLGVRHVNLLELFRAEGFNDQL